MNTILNSYMHINIEIRKMVKHIGLEANSICILYLLEKHDMHIQQIADKIGITISTVTRLLDRLEKDGYVLRHKYYSIDERRRYAILTYKGYEKYLGIKQWLIL